ncbi:MAG: histidine--tRNA ligase [Proteobacteria bacterium]|nr:histidine--tRNA ligase [Pseudomonadota bacterium]
MKTLQIVKGMHDILPADMPKWHFVEQTYRSLVEKYGYCEVRTPVLEPLELFVRGIGETTDIVEKEMYAFEDKGGALLALRPEGTASAIRAYIQHNLQAQQPQTKWFYVGPMFRRERPAKGRYRQFYQAGAELIGVDAPAADAEIIDMAVQFIKGLGIDDVSVQLNSLGDSATRPVFKKALVTYFSQYTDDLCGDCRRRIETNPLRLLDCKKKRCGEIAGGAPSVLEFLSEEATAHFDSLRRLLDLNETPYNVVPTMVRGLDYYTRTIFEVQIASKKLGAQAAVLGGGRYDNLIKQLGGRGAPAIGFSFGIERLLMILEDSAIVPTASLVFVAGVGDGGVERSFEVSRRLRTRGIKVEISYANTSLKSQLKRANRLGANVAVIAGEDEAVREAITIRNMKDSAQKEVPLRDLEKEIEAIL